MKIPKKKLPRDSNQRAYEIVRLSTEEPEEPDAPAEPNPAIEEPKKERSAISEYLSTIGRKGGLKGGTARKDSLTPERRKEISQKAAKARWDKKH
jgi:hypothetical protein